MFLVTGLQFSYTQAPDSMKSVIQGCWQLTVAIGNIIVTIVVGKSLDYYQTMDLILINNVNFMQVQNFSIHKLMSSYYLPF